MMINIQEAWVVLRRNESVFNVLHDLELFFDYDEALFRAKELSFEAEQAFEKNNPNSPYTGRYGYDPHLLSHILDREYESSKESSYDSGYESGQESHNDYWFEQGHEAGYHEGHSEGLSEGFQDGFDEGFTKGQQEPGEER